MLTIVTLVKMTMQCLRIQLQANGVQAKHFCLIFDIQVVVLWCDSIWICNTEQVMSIHTKSALKGEMSSFQNDVWPIKAEAIKLQGRNKFSEKKQILYNIKFLLRILPNYNRKELIYYTTHVSWKSVVQHQSKQP